MSQGKCNRALTALLYGIGKCEDARTDSAYRAENPIDQAGEQYSDIGGNPVELEAVITQGVSLCL